MTVHCGPDEIAKLVYSQHEHCVDVNLLESVGMSGIVGGR